jgi:hypothetical protein
VLTHVARLGTAPQFDAPASQPTWALQSNPLPVVPGWYEACIPTWAARSDLRSKRGAVVTGTFGLSDCHSVGSKPDRGLHFKFASFPDEPRLTAANRLARQVVRTIRSCDTIDIPPHSRRGVYLGSGGSFGRVLLSRARLAEALAPFIAAGRRVSRGRRRRADPPGGPRVDRAAVRAWAREAGLAVSEWGRISADVMRQYEAVH